MKIELKLDFPFSNLRATRIIGELDILHGHEKAATTAAVSSIAIVDISGASEKTPDLKRIYEDKHTCLFK